MKKSSNKKRKKIHVELCQKFGVMGSELPLAKGKWGDTILTMETRATSTQSNSMEL